VKAALGGTGISSNSQAIRLLGVSDSPAWEPGCQQQFHLQCGHLHCVALLRIIESVAKRCISSLCCGSLRRGALLTFGCEKPQIPDSKSARISLSTAIDTSNYSIRRGHLPSCSRFGFASTKSHTLCQIFALPSAHALFPRSSDERRCALFSSHPCTSGHLDAIPASNIKFPAISHSAFEVNSALALGGTPEDGVGSAVYADSALVTARALHNWDDCAR